MLKPIAHNHNRMVANILNVWDATSAPERLAGGAWYLRAHHTAKRMGERHGLPFADVATVVAILSPSVKWERNVIDAETLISAHRGKLPFGSFTVSTYGPNKRKAWSFLDGSLPVVFGPRAQKTQAFSALIAHPDGAEVVLDGHALCIALLGERRAIAQAPRVSPKAYMIVAESYRIAARSAGVQPHHMQAVTWMAWRRVEITQKGVL